MVREDVEKVVSPVLKELEEIDAMMLSCILIESLSEELLVKVSKNLHDFMRGYRGVLR